MQLKEFAHQCYEKLDSPCAYGHVAPLTQWFDVLANSIGEVEVSALVKSLLVSSRTLPQAAMEGLNLPAGTLESYGEAFSMEDTGVLGLDICRYALQFTDSHAYHKEVRKAALVNLAGWAILDESDDAVEILENHADPDDDLERYRIDTLGPLLEEDEDDLYSMNDLSADFLKMPSDFDWSPEGPCPKCQESCEPPRNPLLFLQTGHADDAEGSVWTGCLRCLDRDIKGNPIARCLLVSLLDQHFAGHGFRP